MASAPADIIGSAALLLITLFGSAGLFQNASNRAKSLVIRPVQRLETTGGADAPMYHTALRVMSVGRYTVTADDLKRPLTLTFWNSQLQSFAIGNRPTDSNVSVHRDKTSDGLSDVLVVSFDKLKPKQNFDLTFAWTGQANLPALAHPIPGARIGNSEVRTRFLALSLNRATVVGQYLIAACLIFLATTVAAAAWYRVGHWFVGSAFAGIALAALWYITPVLIRSTADDRPES